MAKSANLRFFIATLAAFLLFSASAAWAQVAGSVTSLLGDVHVEHAGTTVPATPGMGVAVGDRIVTGPNSRVTITLTDNSKLELDQSSTLVIDHHVFTATSRETKLTLFSGLVRSLVSYTSPTPKFDVYTPNAVASARGTWYDTSTRNRPPGTMSAEDRKKYKDCRRFTHVSVYEGTVGVTNTTNPSAASVNVPAGDETIVICGLVPLSASPITAAAAATTTTLAPITPAVAAATTTTAAATTVTGALTSTTGLIVGGGVFVAGATAAGVVAGTSSGGPSPTPVPLHALH